MMNYADKYAQEHGYKDAGSMLMHLKTKVISPSAAMHDAVNYSIHDAVIRALRIVNLSNDEKP